MTARRIRPTGFARVARALVCTALVGLGTLPPGFDAIAAPLGEAVPCGEEGGSEPEITSVAARSPSVAPDRGVLADARRSWQRRVTVRLSVTPIHTPFGPTSATFHLRC